MKKKQQLKNKHYSYSGLEWEWINLFPRYFQEKKRPAKSKNSGYAAGFNELQKKSKVSVDITEGQLLLGLKKGYGKISNAGYDQILCHYTKLPAANYLKMNARVEVRCYPNVNEQTNQEGFGLFIRDTLDLDAVTGYPYSNMAAVGGFHGCINLFGRTGIKGDDKENIKSFFRTGQEKLEGLILDCTLVKCGDLLQAYVKDEKGKEYLSPSMPNGEICVDQNAFQLLEPDNIYMGFMAANGCEISVDLDSVSVDISDEIPCEEISDLHVTVNGKTSGRGDIEDPIDIQTAIKRCRAGQTIILHPGIYKPEESIFIAGSNSGTSSLPKRIKGENSESERVLIDFSFTENSLIIEGNYWVLDNITITHGFGFQIRGSHNRVKNCVAISNLETGFLVRHRNDDSPKEEWPSYNEVIDCISCHNKDRSERNADGFACKVSSGEGNRFVHCIAFLNSDDGFDLFSKNRLTGAVKLTECSSWMNGYELEESALIPTKGNGNGFKLGGSGLAIHHIAEDCDAVGNKAVGFTSNTNPIMHLVNCKAGNNKTNLDYYYTGLKSRHQILLNAYSECDQETFDAAAWISRKMEETL